MGYTEGGDLMRKVLPENWQGGNYVGKGLEGLGGGNYDTVFFDSPSADRNYIAQFDESGKLVGPLQQQMADSWYDREGPLGIPVGAFLPVAAAFGAAYLPELIGAGAAGGGGAGAGISEGVMAGLETGGFGAGASGISPGVAAGLETGGFGAGASGISEGVMAGLEGGVGAVGGEAAAGLPALTEGAAAAGTAAGDVALVDGAVGALGQPLSPWEAVKKFGLTKALQLGLVGATLVDALTKKGGGGGGGTAGVNLITPQTYTRTRNPDTKGITAAQARAYMQGDPAAANVSKQQRYFDSGFTALPTYDARTGETFVQDPVTGRLISKAEFDEAAKSAGATKADGGLMALADGGYVFDAALADGGLMALAGGGSTLGGYSDGGRLLRGPGDGVSDSIPATIGDKQPARLADGEFVVPARIVSELGNGSTEAGARKLYKMMARIQAGRRKTVGKNAVAKDSKAEKHLPA
jgi:hypothetical protein